MLRVEFTLHRFICDVATFTSLFTDKGAIGGRVRDTSAFQCCWKRLPRARPATLPDADASSDAYDGNTAFTYFRSAGADMVLSLGTPNAAPHELQLDSASEVLALFVRPSQYDGEGPGVVAKGTLDALSYAAKPRKNYAIKLRDAAGQVVGRLIFTLCVTTATVAAARKPRDSTAATDRPAASVTHSNALLPARAATRMVELAETAPATTSQPAEQEAQATVGAVGSRESRDSAAVPAFTLPERSSLTRDEAGAVPLELMLESVYIKSEAISLYHPASLLLGAEYHLKLRYGARTFYSVACICNSPREVRLSDQTIRLSVPGESTEKLRFSLWENRTQVAGFSLDPHKFRVSTAGPWKPYTIPFNYLPTRQASALDVSVRARAEDETGEERSDAEANSSAKGHIGCHSYGPMEPDRQLSYDRARKALLANKAVGRAIGASPSSPHPPDSHQKSSASYSDNTDVVLNVAATGASPEPIRKEGMIELVTDSYEHAMGDKVGNALRALIAPPDTTSATARSPKRVSAPPPPTSPPQQPPPRASTPLHRAQPRHRGDGDDDDNGDNDDGSGVAGRPGNASRRATPLRRMSDLRVTATSPPQRDTHAVEHVEDYLADVIARIERQQHASRRHSSLVEEWIGWQRTRSASRDSGRRSPSVSSALSRDGSVSSVLSRRAVSPLPTKSFVQHSLLTPFVFEDKREHGGPARHSSSARTRSRTPVSFLSR